MSDCIFCKIVNKEINSSLVFEDDKMLAFRDINPKAATHLLLVPKKHVASIIEMQDEDQELVGHLFLKARDIAKEMGLEGYKLQINVGEHGGQEVFHLHVHLLSKFS